MPGAFDSGRDLAHRLVANSTLSFVIARGEIQERLIRRYERLLRAEVASATRQVGRRAEDPARRLGHDVGAAMAAARKAAALRTGQRLTAD
jgi:hypothetical protein